jgi:hypothetical protein
MADLHEKLSDMHALVIDQVMQDLQNGDRKARQEAMALLKQSNIQAVSQESSTLSKLASKLDFSSLSERVVEFKRPSAAG